MSLLKLKIIIVDDDDDYVKDLSRYLKRKGHSVFTSATINEAEQIVRNQKERLLPIDVAFIDFMIPNTSGIAISHCLKSIDPDLFLVGITEHDHPNNIKKLIQEGAFIQIISKFDDESETIDRTLGTALTSKRERRKSGKDEL